jgi:RNA polymerase sigma-70 factor (ECF subfamily)
MSTFYAVKWWIQGRCLLKLKEKRFAVFFPLWDLFYALLIPLVYVLAINKQNYNFAFSTWLFKIASNNCIDFIRKKRIKVTSMDSGIVNDNGDVMKIDARSNTLNPEETVMQGQRVVHMRLLVSKLKPKYRELVEKRYFQELSYEEIATEMNLPLGTVKAQLFRARDFLASMAEKTKDSI